MEDTEEFEFLGMCVLNRLLDLICIKSMLNALSHKGLPYL